MQSDMGSSQSAPKGAAVVGQTEKQPSADKGAADTLKRLRLESNPDSNGTVQIKSISSWEDNVANDPTKRLARTILSRQDFKNALIKQPVLNAEQQVFNVKIPFEAKNRTNQMSSGRCWLFATTNVARLAVMERHKLEEFELSQSYLAFYDWLEKSNWFLEQMIDLANEDLDSRIVQHLLGNPQNDGGQWDMAVNLVTKYGLVPKTIYPESFSSSNSRKINELLEKKLRDYTFELRDMYARALESAEQTMGSSHTVASKRQAAVNAARSLKDEQMAQVYGILSIAMGAPPQPDDKFTWEYYDKDQKFHTVTATPLSFYKTHCSPFDAADCISLINDPRNPYDKLYTVDRLGNVYNGRPVLYVNVAAEELMTTAVNMLKAGRAVWFGCDVGQSSDGASGVMDLDLFDVENAFGVKLRMNKAQRLQARESLMTHAMVFSAVHLDDKGQPVRWRVENSWGDKERGDKGFFICSNEWLKAYVYQVVVPRGMTSRKNRDIFANDKDAVVLPAWDPMGSLA